MRSGILSGSSVVLMGVGKNDDVQGNEPELDEINAKSSRPPPHPQCGRRGRTPGWGGALQHLGRRRVQVYLGFPKGSPVVSVMVRS